jgi:hypothetical protein
MLALIKFKNSDLSFMPYTACRCYVLINSNIDIVTVTLNCNGLSSMVDVLVKSSWLSSMMDVLVQSSWFPG